MTCSSCRAPRSPVLGSARSRSSVTIPGANVQYVWPHPSKQYLYAVSSDGGPGTIPGTRHIASAFRIGYVLEHVPTPRMILGGLTSMLIGFLLFLRVEPGMNYADFLLPTMIGIGLGALVICLLGSIPPAVRAARINIVEAVSVD